MKCRTVLLALVAALAAGASAGAAAVSGTWKIVPSPNSGTGHNYLFDVAAASANEVWAVGQRQDRETTARPQTLVERWDGASWSVVPSPNVEGTTNSLSGVAVAAPDDAWAVGYSTGALDASTTALILHWDGTRWTSVPAPSTGRRGGSGLYGVAARAANDVWAVGYYYNRKTDGRYQTLVLHWDGASWSVVPTPTIPNATFGSPALRAVAALAADDVWAVGSVVLHWDGSTWRLVSTPRFDLLHDVAAVSGRDVWAVGSYFDAGHKTRVLHWDGTTWSAVASPNVEYSGSTLHSVAAVSADDVWAVGNSFRTSTTGGSNSFTETRTLAVHWDGVAWSIVPTPNPDVQTGCCTSTFSQLEGVAAVSAGDVWGVGYYSPASIQTLTERYTIP